MILKKRTKIRYSRYVTSKIGKTKAVEANVSLKEYVPTTKWMTSETLKQMLNQHKMVYIKPNVGMFGNGVIRVEMSEGGGEIMPYSYQLGVNLKRFKTFDDMYASIIKKTGKKQYLVQKGIHLLKYRGNRFDLRIMVQQSPRRSWETTGVIGRVAHPSKIVTNFHSGGTLKPVDTLLHSYLSAGERDQYIQKLHVLGMRVAKAIHAKYRGVKEIGVDVALDKELHPWILEVNTSPDPYIFRRLRDKRIFSKIQRYGRANGRL
ncbi:YheC/YheD family protein [Paenibacillus sp. LMG 31457]|uniref:YheC/YheD family protein n=2 Tax=Paenibacillus planticolens TaxID=2654976 RepID=A0ABX1ZLI0_9BACL|nr:YheC/YheD family protein [Paenibacillus planticolens]